MASPPSPDARLTRAAWIGSSAAWLVGALLITRTSQPFAGIHPAQASAWLHGRWDLPSRPDVLGLEAFVIDGRRHTYFGIWPSLLRVPFAALPDSWDGRLAIASMLLASGLLLWFSARLSWAVRDALRPGAPVGRAEPWAVAGFQLLVGAGSIATFLMSRGVVYHEMELWGIAGAVATADALFRFARAPSTRGAAWVAVWAAITTTSRISVGLGAVAGVALFTAGYAWPRTRARFAAPSQPDSGRTDSRQPDSGRDFRRHLAVLAAAVIVPVALHAGANTARFGSPTRLPLDHQVFSDPDGFGTLNDAREAALAANDGSLFGLQYVPTTLWQYLRPDAIRVDDRAPFVAFPPRAHVFGDAVFDTLDRSSSLPASLPGFVVLGLVGVVALVRRPALTALWGPVLGGALGTSFVLTIAFVSHRYLADFFPPLLVLAIVGMQVLVARRRSRAVLAGVVAICVAGGAISFGLARVFQRPCGVPPPSPSGPVLQCPDAE